MSLTARDDQVKETAYVLLTGVVVREGNMFVSSCPELEVASCGDAVDEAFENLADAVGLYLDDLAETGELANVLRTRNIRVEWDSTPLQQYRLPVEPAEFPGAHGPMYQYQRLPLPMHA